MFGQEEKELHLSQDQCVVKKMFASKNILIRNVEVLVVNI